ncbi:MAG: PilZ domain-containing protein [Planctomycetes bacterium]|nr:PilZ domain-containing protein [Planctomycetota bacterium]
MFEQTFSFWRRLFGSAAEPEPSAVVALEDDRRLWMRYATDLQGNVQAADKTDADKILAQVRDLSAGGANVLVDRPLEPGHILTLELPTRDGEVRTVLACVVRTVSHGPGQWSLGCVFSRELSGADLAACGAQKTAANHDDQRVWVRYTCPLKARYRKYGDSSGDMLSVHVLNLSANGIGLAVSPALDAGALLTVDLLDRNGRMVCGILACVVHTTRRASGDFAVGCNFIRELTDEELRSLL